MAATSSSDVTAIAATTATATPAPAVGNAAAGNNADGPVINLVNKRLRALRKKLNRIVQTEESLAQGKTLNQEQQDLLRSKSSVLSIIDELEKLRAPLSLAVSEEVSLALENHQSDSQPAEKSEEENDVAELNKQDGVVEDLLSLLYLGSLFDVMPHSVFTSLMLTRTVERNCCLTYDYVSDDATDVLGERDLDLISALRGLLISRPANSNLPHKDALQRCIQHAKLWLANSDQPIDSDSNVTYASLREKLDKIMSSDYYTTTPEMTVPVEMAAAAANFGSFQVPVHGSMVPVSVPMHVEGSVAEYQGTEDSTTQYEAYEPTENHSEPVEEQNQGDFDVENSPEEVSVQTEQLKQQGAGVEENQGNVDFNVQENVDFNTQENLDLKEQQQHVPRRNNQNQRGGRGGGGGGRRGFPNGRGVRGSGRGSGGYQNGRQYYDQPGNYYPRNNQYQRVRGRGGAGGGNNYYNHPASSYQGGQVQANGGLAS